LRHSLWRIQKSFTSKASPLVVDDLTIALDIAKVDWLDIRAVEMADENATADELLSALSAYRGELLPGFYDDWVVLEREHLQAVFDQKMARLLALLQEQGRWSDVLEWGERWVSLGQKPEPAYRALMTAHAAIGQMSKVAGTYERCEKALREFGVQPSEQTTSLFKDLKSGPGTLNRLSSSSKLPPKEASSSIPIPLTSFIGRQKDLKEIARLLSSTRLLTLTGPGGVGKTRLAIQAARDSTRKFRDGTYWVSLVGLTDPNLISQEIAQSLDMRETSNKAPMEMLMAQLKSRDILIVLDNCEHVIRACAQVAEQLLAACPKLKILATSIEALGLFNETIWHVPSLPLPEHQNNLALNDLREIASVALFVDRAANAKPGFSLTEKNAKFVSQVCQRLDGIPLAIELAAARIKVLSVDEISTRLDDRFSLLTTGSRTAIARHQTLRATLDWSHDLLTEPERSLFRRLSVFVGGFTLEAAEAICGHEWTSDNILDLLGRLVDKSLVIVEAESGVGGTRYHLLETIRQYALEKLASVAETPAIRDRHLAYYLALAESSESKVFGSQSAEWFGRFDRELDNFRAAMEWSTNSGQAIAALRIAGSLVYFWFVHGLLASEWYDRIQQALSRPEGRQRTLARAKALNGVGFMYWGDMYAADKRPQIEEALSIAQEFGDPVNTATALRNLGLLENIGGNYGKARSFLEQSLDIWRQMGADGRGGRATTLMFLGDVALTKNESGWARSLYEESAAILRELGDINFLAYAVRRLGQLAWREGDRPKAIALCRQSLSLNLLVGDPRGIVACLSGFSAIAVANREFAQAAVLLAAVEAQLDSIGVRLSFVDRMEFEHNLTCLRGELDQETLSRFWAKGKMLTVEDAVQLALATS
jgi:non-specific serine/threonine protein kinase